jgi:hypothetical protein
MTKVSKRCQAQKTPHDWLFETKKNIVRSVLDVRHEMAEKHPSKYRITLEDESELERMNADRFRSRGARRYANGDRRYYVVVLR